MSTLCRIILSTLATVFVVSAQNCQTPNQRPGNCIGLDQCVPLRALLTAPNRQQSDIDLVRRSACGFNGNNPIVCCPIDSGRENNNNQGNGGGNQWGNGGSGTNTGGTNPTVQSRLLPTDCGKQLSDRIFGGNWTALDEFPWMALLEYQKPTGKTTACGGVLISNRYVLTAAHCISPASLPKSWALKNVRLGEWNTLTDPDCIPDGDFGNTCNEPVVTVPVEEQIVHENYNPTVTGQLFDIALVRLARAVKFTDFIKPICLPNSGDLSNKLQVSGWGSTETRSDSNLKLKAIVPLVDKNICSIPYKNQGVQLGNGQFCAGGEKGVDSCRGDSGGPLMQVDKGRGETTWVVAGIVSFGPVPCGMEDWPGVYTKVWDYKNWILSKLRS